MVGLGVSLLLENIDPPVGLGLLLPPELELLPVGFELAPESTDPPVEPVEELGLSELLLVPPVGLV